MGFGGRIPPLLDAFAPLFCLIPQRFDSFVTHPLTGRFGIVLDLRPPPAQVAPALLHHMNILPIRIWVTAAGALLLGACPAFADGKLYAEKVPTTIPYQRALILHDAGVQTLVLQSQYEIPGTAGVRSLGWVVPVPAPPDIASLDTRRTEQVFRALDELSMPAVTEFGPLVLMALIGVSMAVVLLGFGWAFMTRDAKRKRSCVRVGRWAGVVFLLSLLVGPFFIHMRKGVAGVEILDTRHTGIYDVRVVSSNTAAELSGWLNANSFRFGPEDETAIQAYLSRGWCFVVAKIEPTANLTQPEAVSRGLLAPLILRFPSPAPVYPVALTATGGQPTEILIYLASNTPLTTDSPLIRRFVGEWQRPDAMHELFHTDPPEFFEPVLPDFRYLSKFRATLTPAEMARDIEFRPDPNTPSFREHRYRW
jgi:hypothetical protein